MATALVNQNNSLPANTKRGTLKELLTGDPFKQAVTSALPSHLRPDRFIRIALTAITKTPALQECDQASFFNCLLTLSQLGIEPDGRRAHLIPFRNSKRGITECTLICDYKGLVELAMRSGKVSAIHADVVCDKDDFEYDRGEIKKHKINFREPRGPVYAAYALVRFKDGTEKCDVLGRDEIESVRKRSRAANNGPWVTDWSEMAKKTAFRRLSKWIELSPEVRDAIEADDEQFDHPHVELPATVTIDHLASLPQVEDAAVEEIRELETGDVSGEDLGDVIESVQPAPEPPPVQQPVPPPAQQSPVRKTMTGTKEKFGKDSPSWAKFDELRTKFGHNLAIEAKDQLGWTNTPFDRLSTKQLDAIIQNMANAELDKELAETNRTAS